MIDRVDRYRRALAVLPIKAQLAELAFDGRSLLILRTDDPAALMVLRKAGASRSDYAIERDAGAGRGSAALCPGASSPQNSAVMDPYDADAMEGLTRRRHSSLSLRHRMRTPRATAVVPAETGLEESGRSPRVVSAPPS